MPTKWLDRTQPQTLMSATILLYLNAALGLITLEFLYLFPIGLLLVAGQVFGGLGIANERKLGYWLAVGVSILPLVLVVLHPGAADIFTLIFQIALVVLLLHNQSRAYKRTWFH
jgi:hypothetical protein